MIHVRRVNEDKQGLQDFIGLPYRLYAGTPNWCPPFKPEQRLNFSLKNPFMRQAEVALFVAYLKDRPVARVSAHIDPAYNDYHQVKQGFFGFFECEPECGIAQVLMSVAENWLREQSIPSVMGPFNFSTNHGIGLLTDGFEHPPVLTMPYTHAGYPALLESIGYTKVKELVSYAIEQLDAIPDRLIRLATRAREKWDAEFRVERFDPERMELDMKTVGRLYNEAWSANWGYAPISDEEMAHFTDSVKSFAEPDAVWSVMKGEEPVGFLMGLPDINEALIRIPNASWLPTGWWTLLNWKRHVKTCMVHALGMRPKYRNLGLELLLFLRLYELRRDWPQCKRLETSWILEDNVPMRRLIEICGGEVIKRFAVYGKDL